MIALRFMIAGLVALFATDCGAAVVEGPSGLAKAVREAAPGSVLHLLPGNHGAVVVEGVRGPLRLVAAQPDDPPIFSRLEITNSNDITFEDIRIDYRAGPDAPLWLYAAEIRKTTNVIFRRMLFDGDLATGGPAEDLGRPTGTALVVRESRGITIENSEFRRFERGIVLSRSDDIAIRNSHLHRLRHDGIIMSAVRRVQIEGNYIGNFDRVANSADHPDMIQMFSTGTDHRSEDIRILNNLLLSGHGLWTQSIHLRNERVDHGQAGPEMFYRDIEISGNVIANAHLNGINVGETRGLKIRRNTLIRNDRSAEANFSDSLATPLIRVAQASRDVTIEGNVAPVLPHPVAQDWKVMDNVVLPVSDYDSALVDAINGDPLDPASYVYRADGSLGGKAIGAPVLRSTR